MTKTVAVAFTPAPASQSPNLRNRTANDVSSTYYKLIVLAFSSVRRWNPDVQLVLITDAPPPDQYESLLRGIDVAIEIVPFAHRPPNGFYPRFNASLYTLDAMRHLSTRDEPTRQALLLDPDVLCLKDLTPVFSRWGKDQLLVYPTGFDPGEMSQGISAYDAVPMHAELNAALVDPPVHYGGELYGFTQKSIVPVLQRAEEAFAAAIDRWQRDLPHMVTEEHIMNYALRTADLVDGSNDIRRIWTSPLLRTVQGDEGKLPLWHMPSEKDRGFRPLYDACLASGGWFWTADARTFTSACGRAFGIPRRGVSRWVYDFTARHTKRARAHFKRETLWRKPSQSTN